MGKKASQLNSSHYKKTKNNQKFTYFQILKFISFNGIFLIAEHSRFKSGQLIKT